MRIVYFAAAAAIGGGNQSLLTLASGLRERGGEPIMVCPGPGAMADECRRRSFATYEMHYESPSWDRPMAVAPQFWRWRTWLRRIEPDLLHANDFSSARAASLAATSLGRPIVCHVRFPPGPEVSGWVFRHLPKPKAFIFTSDAIRRESEPALAAACPRAQRVVIHNAVDVQAFRPVTRSRAAGAPLRIGIVANFSPVKRHADFFAMAKSLVERGRACEFWVVGDDISGTAYRSEYVTRVGELGLARYVRFLGHRADVAAVLADLDVVVSTSEYESFGRTLVEAMATGLPVVASDVGGIPEVVDSSCGVLVPVGDIAAFVKAIESLLDPAARERMGQAGRVRATTLFDRPAHVGRVVALYERVLGPGRAAAAPSHS